MGIAVLMEQTDAVLIIDKKVGLSSAKVVTRVKGITRARKVGHAGTLDPFASGVLVCCLNRATRVAQYLLFSEKQYRAVLRLGVATDTLDGTGQVVEEKQVPKITSDQIESVLKRYTGETMQTPPVYSALKHQGKPLYHWARKGEPVQKEARPVTIKKLEVVSVDLPNITLEATCSAGTYIRQLGADIGSDLGCGGHLTELTRLRSGVFDLNQAMTLDQLEKAVKEKQLDSYLIRPADALPHMAEYVADEALKQKVAHGVRLTAQDGLDNEQEGPFKIIDSNRKLLAIVEPDDTFRPVSGHDQPFFKYRAVFI